LGAWFIFPAESSTVFNSDPDSLWLEMIRKTEMQMARREPGDRDWSGIPPAFPLSKLRAAHGFLEKSQMFGKVVVNP